MYINNHVKTKMVEVKELLLRESRARGFSMIPRKTPVSVKAWFFTRRPDSDFTSRVRARGLTEKAKTDECTMVAVKPDTDNMCKFLLDAMTGAIYQDDSQVVELHVLKMRDSEGLCLGKMAIEVTVIHQAKAESMPSF